MLEYLVASFFVPTSYSLVKTFSDYYIPSFAHVIRKEIDYEYDGHLWLDNLQVIRPVSSAVVGFGECHVLDTKGEDYIVGWNDRLSGLSFHEALNIHLRY